MTAPEPVVLTDGERADIAQVFHGCRWLSPERAECIERILADRLAADRAAHEALRKAVTELADDFDSNVDWSNGRNNYGDNDAWESAARELRAALAATAPTPPQDAATGGGS